MLKAIILNLDGIITDLTKFHFLAWKSVFSHYHILFTLKDFEELANHSRKYIVNAIFEKNKVNCDDTMITNVANEKNDLYRKIITDTLTPNEVNPKILELLAQARTKDLKIAVMSNSKNADLIIERLGLSKAFDYVSYPSSDFNDSATRVIGDSTATQSLLQLFKMSGFKGNECIGIENTEEGIDEYNLFNVYSVCVNNYDPKVSAKAKMAFHSIVDINLDQIIFQYYTKNKEA